MARSKKPVSLRKAVRELDPASRQPRPGGLREARSCTVELPDNPTTPARHDGKIDKLLKAYGAR